MAGYTKGPDKKTLVAIIIVAILVIAAIVGTVVFLKNRGTTEATDLASYNEQETGTTQEERTTTDTQEQSGEPATQSTDGQETEATEPTEEPANVPETDNTGTTTAGGNQNQGNVGIGATGGTTGTTSSTTGTTTTGGTVAGGTTGTANAGATGTTTDNIQETTISREETIVHPDQLVAEGEDKVWAPTELNASFASAYSNIDSAEPTDVTVTKTATTQSGSTLVQAGETITYTITVQNNTNEKIERIYVTDKIPANTTYVSSTPNAEKFDNGTVVTSLRWLVDIEANATTTVNFTVMVNEGATGTIENVAIANGEESNKTETSIIKTDKTSVITRNETPVDVAKVGDIITYTISVENTGKVPGSIIVKDEDLANILQNAKMNGNVTVGDKTYSADELISGILVDVAENSTAKVVFSIEVTNIDGEIANVALVGDNEEPTDPEVVNTVDINATKKADKTSVKVGEQITYTIELTNKGNKEGTVVLRDPIPNGTTFETATLFDSEGNKQATITEAQLTSGNYSIAVPGEKTVKVEIVVTAVQKTAENDYTSKVQNIAYITEDPNTPEEPIPSEETKVANITAVKSSSYEGEELHELDVITYTITLTNHGEAAGTVKVSDTVPEGTTLVPNSIKVNNEGNYEEKQLNEGIDVTVAENGGTATVTFQVRVNPFTGADTKVIRNADAKVDGTPTNPTDDTVVKEYEQISGEKKWITDKNVNTLTATIELLRDGKSTTPATTTTVTGNNTYAFNKLDKYDLTDGHEYTYSVKEVEVEGFTTLTDKNNFTNIDENATTSIDGAKTWITPVEDVNTLTATIELIRDGNEEQPIDTTTVTGNGTYNFNNLPKYDLIDGHEYTYSVKEVPVTGYDTNQDENDFTNIIQQEYTAEIRGTKTWVTPEDPNTLTATIELLRDGKPTTPEATTTTVTGNGTYSFTGLPRYNLETGKEYVYSVKEVEVSGYDTTQEGNNFINTIQPGSQTIEGTKTWNDANNQDGKRPSEITVILNYRVGTEGEFTEYTRTTVKADKNGEWKYSFENVPKYENGVEIQYQISEESVDGYTTTVDEKNQYNLINTYTPETIDIHGQKTWDDVNNKDGKRPTEISVNLLANGIKVKSQIVTAENNWEYTFEDVPKYSNGKEIKYTVSEDEVVGYKATVTSYDITNRREVPDITIKKTAEQVILNGTQTTTEIDQSEEAITENDTETICDLQAVNNGDIIIYNIVVKNEGNVILHDVNVTDERLVNIMSVTPINDGVVGTATDVNKATVNVNDNLLNTANVPTTIEPNDGYILTVSYKVQLFDVANADKMSNTAIVTSTETPNPEESTATVMVDYDLEPSIKKEITKVNETATKPGVEDKETNTITYNDKANKTDVLTYKITATNSGNITIKDFKLTDDRDVTVVSATVLPAGTNITITDPAKTAGKDLLEGQKATLEPGETVEVVVTYKIGSMDRDNTDKDTSEIKNIATMTGEAENRTEGEDPITQIEKDATAIIEANMKSDIEIHKYSGTNGREIKVGSTITYQVVLENNSPVPGTTTVKEEIPANTELVGDITVHTTGGETTKLSETQIEDMKDGNLELAVPGNGEVTITFTVKVMNEALGTTITNTATDGEGDTSETITNNTMKEINIYETKTELGQQSVVLVVDMTLSLGAKVDADADKNETDVLATGGYQNTRWYQLKKALNSFVDSYLKDNVGEKRSIAIVGFCDGVVLNTGFMTDPGAVKEQYENIFNETQYNAAIDFAEYCSKQDNPEEAFRKIFEDNGKEDSYSDTSKFKDNGDGTYVIDVDLLQILDKTSRYIGYNVTKPGLQSGTNIASGLKEAKEKVKSQVKEGIATSAILITDGNNNKDNENGSPSEVDDYANEIRSQKVNGIKSKLYAIGFTKASEDLEDLLKGQHDMEVFKAHDTTALEKAFENIKENEDINKEHNLRTVTGKGTVLLSDKGTNINIANNAKVTIYTGNNIENAPIKVVLNGADFKLNYVTNNEFNLRKFLIGNGVPEDATINMQIYTVE